MPISIREDSKGQYFQYGTTGKKYYFNPESLRSFNKAFDKALKQSAAIMLSQYNARQRELKKKSK